MSPAAKATPATNTGVKPQGASERSTSDAYRDTKWRLQIP